MQTTGRELPRAPKQISRGLNVSAAILSSIAGALFIAAIIMIGVRHGRAADTFFLWLESTAFHTWLVESPCVCAFPLVLTLHTIGMGFLAGFNAALDFRILGIAAQIPVGEFRRFLPVMWFGFWLNAASGVALVIGYPTKALTNPVFYLKLALIAAALALLVVVRRGVLGDPTTSPTAIPRRMKMLAAASLACWAAATTAGRLLAYTYTRLTAG